MAGCPGSTCLFDLDHVWPHIVMKINQRCKLNVRSNVRVAETPKRRKHSSKRREHKSWDKQVKEVIKKMWKSQRTKERKAKTKTKKTRLIQPGLEPATTWIEARRAVIAPSENCMNTDAKFAFKERVGVMASWRSAAATRCCPWTWKSSI